MYKDHWKPECRGARWIWSPRLKTTRSVRFHDAEQWHNPFVVVNRDGYELILRPDPRTTERLNLSELEWAC